LEITGLGRLKTQIQTLKKIVMKNKINIWLAFAVILTIAFSSCSKKESINPSNDNSVVGNEMVEQEIAVLNDQTDDEFENSELMGGSETEGFYLDNDGIPDAYQITESTADYISGSKRAGEARRFIACMKELNLSKDQIESLRKAFKIYEDCHSSILVRHRLAIKSLLAKYNDKHAELVKALRNGRITKEEFAKKVQELRKAFMRERHEINSKVRTALKDCYSHLLKNIHRILNERQWKAFVNCYRK
jgi:hypothetical protein